MRLVAVSRILDEEELIEPFIRHHAALADHHIILDNGSSDRTLPILGALLAEGFPLTVLRNDAVFAGGAACNTVLYETACRDFAADWVLFLAADEFIDHRDAGDFRGFLAALPDEAPCLGVGLREYPAAAPDSVDELNVVRRLIRRWPERPAAMKVFVRGGFESGQVAVPAGACRIVLDGAPVEPLMQDRVVLAHFPNRSPWQYAAKIITGRLQLLAAGERPMARSIADTGPPYNDLLLAPGAWLRTARDRAAGLQVSADLIDDPIPYLGGALRHTQPPDDEVHGFRHWLATATRMAMMLGAIIDAAPGARQAAEARCRDAIPLFGTLPGGGALDFSAILTEIWRGAADADFGALLAEGWSTPQDWGVPQDWSTPQDLGVPQGWGVPQDWGVPEDWGVVWGVGEAHVLRLGFAAVPPHGVVIEADVSAFLPAGRERQDVAVFAGGRLLARWAFTPEHDRAIRRVILPPEVIAAPGAAVKLTFSPSHTAAPAPTQDSEDRRQLGMALHRLRQLSL